MLLKVRLQGKSRVVAALAARVKKAWSRADVVPAASCYRHPAVRGTAKQGMK
jgi:hypothetical protein